MYHTAVCPCPWSSQFLGSAFERVISAGTLVLTIKSSMQCCSISCTASFSGRILWALIALARWAAGHSSFDKITGSRITHIQQAHRPLCLSLFHKQQAVAHTRKAQTKPEPILKRNRNQPELTGNLSSKGLGGKRNSDRVPSYILVPPRVRRGPCMRVHLTDRAKPGQRNAAAAWRQR